MILGNRKVEPVKAAQDALLQGNKSMFGTHITHTAEDYCEKEVICIQFFRVKAGG